jgi:hypothetical protein
MINRTLVNTRLGAAICPVSSVDAAKDLNHRQKLSTTLPVGVRGGRDCEGPQIIKLDHIL